MRLTLKFIHNRKNKLNKQGQAQIQLRITFNRSPCYFSTGLYIEPKQWNSAKEKIKSHDNQVRLNAILLEIEKKSWDYYYHNKEKFSAKALLSYLRGVEENKGEVLQFFETEFNKSKLAANTLKQHKLLFKYLKKFNSDLSFKEIDYSFKVSFESWLREQETQQGNKLHPNYIALILRLLKGYTNEAIRSKLLFQDPFLGQKIKTVDGEKVFLHQSELSRIEKLDVSSRRGLIPESKDMFLFSCYTGIRFSDLISLKRGEIQNDAKGLRLRKQLHKTKKNKIKIDLPLYYLFEGKPETLIKKWIEKESVYDEIFSPITLNAYNSHLRLFASLAGIEKKLSSHVARHTCAMILLNEKGASFGTVQNVLGHASIATTQKHYAKMLSRGLDDRLKKITGV